MKLSSRRSKGAWRGRASVRMTIVQKRRAATSAAVKMTKKTAAALSQTGKSPKNNRRKISSRRSAAAARDVAHALASLSPSLLPLLQANRKEKKKLKVRASSMAGATGADVVEDLEFSD